MKKILLLWMLCVTAAFAQNMKNLESGSISTSGGTFTLLDQTGSGTLYLEYTHGGTISGISITVQGCMQGGTCATLTAASGSNPATGDGIASFTGGYNTYKVTATFTGTGVIYVAKVGIQAKAGSGGAGGGGVTQIIAGANVTVSPPGGTGAVTVNSTGGGTSTPSKPVYYFWCFGNSFMAGAGGTSFSGNSSPNSGCSYLVNGSNLSYNNGTPQTLNANQGISGFVTPEIANKLVNTFWQNPNLPVSIFMDGGANDGTWNQTQYAQVLLAMFHYANIPQSNRIFASAATQGGTWSTTTTTSNITPAAVIVSPSNATLPSPGTGMTNSVNGSTLTFAVPSTSTSTNITVTAFVTNSATSTYTVAIDGVLQTDQCSGTTTFSSLPCGGVVSVARSTLNNTVAAQEFATTAGAHSVVITNTSNAPVQILAVDWNPPTNTTLVNPIFFLNANTNYANFSQNNATAFALIAQENANGLPIFPVDQINGIGGTPGSTYAGGTVFTPGAAGAPGINTTSDMATSATSSCPASAAANHPNDCGNVKMYNLVKAVMRANNYVVDRFTAVPYNYILSQTNAWTAGNTFNATLTMGSNISQVFAGGGISGIGNITGTGILALGVETVAFSATPTFSATKSLSRITLTGNVTSSTLPIIGSFGDGTQHCFDIAQNGTGSNTFVWPTNVIGASTVSSAANSHTAQCFTANVASGNYYAVSAVGGATGTAGGDLSGTYPNPTVAQVNGAVVPTNSNVVGTTASNQLVAVTAINGITNGLTTPAADYSTLFGCQGDTSGTASLCDFVTSTAAAGTITTPASHALSTSGIASGSACHIARSFASGGLYNGTAVCSFNSTGGFLFYTSIGHAIGSESWANSLTLGGGGGVFNGTLISNSFVRSGTTYQATNNATIASATTIAPTTALVTISGTAAITTITPPTGFSSSVGGCFDIVATGAWSTVTGGNIAAAMTAVASTPYRACYVNATGTPLWFIK